MITENQILSKATEVLSRPVGTRGAVAWTKGDLARTGNNHSANINDKNACKFCSIGAVERAGFELGAQGSTISRAKDRLGRVMSTYGGCSDIAELNDKRSTTFGQVLIAFDLAQTSAGDQ